MGKRTAREALKNQTQWQDTAHPPAPTPFTFTQPVRSTASPQQVSEQQCGSSCSTERDTICQYCLAGDTHGSTEEGRSIATRKIPEDSSKGELQSIHRGDAKILQCKYWDHWRRGACECNWATKPL